MRNTLMSVNGLFATINTPEALSGDDTYGLPPYDECPAFDVDKYPACPSNWMHGSSKASSYFVPVKAGRGMWFDFTMNEAHSHHVAIVISVQGVNPITGQRVSALNLEKYQNQCPVHKIDFHGGRFCPECGYSWPSQNYLATTTREILWIDGFRNEQGQVRQYIITEEEIRSIAKQVIGDDRVYAIGFAFYLSKKPKPGLTAQYAPFVHKKNWMQKLKESYGGCVPIVPTGATGPTGAQGPQGSPGPSSGWWDYFKLWNYSFQPSSQISPSVRVPQDDAQSLQQLASGNGNLDMYYSTQMINGVEYNMEAMPDYIKIDPNSIPSEIHCSMPPMTMPCMNIDEMKMQIIANSPQCLGVPDEDHWIPTRPTQGAGVSQPDAIPDIRDLKTGYGNQIRLRDSNDFVEASKINKNSRMYKRELVEQSLKKLEIGAGAKIWQEVGYDPESLEFWETEPAGLIYVNYVPVEQAKTIIAAGKRAEKKDGFLAGMPVGN